jgi:hypothetical protein
MLKLPAFLSGPLEAVSKLWDNCKVIVGAGFVAAGIKWLLDALSSVHWVLGAIPAAVLVAGAVWLTNHIKQSSRSEDPSGVLGVLALGLLTVMMVCGWVSFTLHAAYPATYSVPNAYSPGTFVDLYFHTFLDLLPAIDVPKTLNIKPAIESRTVLGGLPILAFKLFVVWLFFDAFFSWRRGREEPK